MQKEYVCPKCGSKSYEEDKISATGGGLSKFMDVQSKNFITITCTNCRYTELYKAKDMNTLGKFLDFLSN
mgnify:CR=1 FL=1